MCHCLKRDCGDHFRIIKDFVRLTLQKYNVNIENSAVDSYPSTITLIKKTNSVNSSPSGLWKHAYFIKGTVILGITSIVDKEIALVHEYSVF